MRLYDNQPSGTVPRAHRLRREASEPEQRLLRGLCETFPSLKWRHQVPFGPYCADVLCFSARLVIEVDGDMHAYAAGYDAARTRFIEREGYHVLRFTNIDVMQNLDGVLVQISFSLRGKEGAYMAKPCGKDEGDRYSEERAA